MCRRLALDRIVFLVLVMLLVTVSVASAAPTPYKWEREQINPLPYYYENWMSANSKRAFYDAAYSWNNETSNKVGFTYNTSFKVYLGEVNDDSVGWDGTAGLTTSGSTILAADAYLNRAYTDYYTSQMRRGTAAHELGHVLGLDEDFDNQLVIMNPSSYERDQFGIYDPTPADVYWIDQMYP